MNASSRLRPRLIVALACASLAAPPARAYDANEAYEDHIREDKFRRIVAFQSQHYGGGRVPYNRGWMGLAFADGEPRVQFYRADDADRVEGTLDAMRGVKYAKEDAQGRSLLGSGLPLHELKLERVIPGAIPGTAFAIFSRRFTGRSVLYDELLLPRKNADEVGQMPYEQQPGYSKDSFAAIFRDESAPREDKRLTVGKRSVIDHFLAAIQEAAKPFAANLELKSIYAVVTPEPAKYSHFQPAASMPWSAARFTDAGKAKLLFAYDWKDIGLADRSTLYEFELVSVTAREGGGFNAVYKSKPASVEGRSEPPALTRDGDSVDCGENCVASTYSYGRIVALSKPSVADALMMLALRKNPDVTPENLHAFVSWAPERAGLETPADPHAGHATQEPQKLGEETQEKVKKSVRNILDDD